MNSTARVERIQTQVSGRLRLRNGLALAIGCLLLGPLAAAADDPTDNDASPSAAVTPLAPARPATSRIPRPRVEDRVAALTKALNLDPAQQGRLTRLLESRRERIGKVWNDPTLPAAYRISATRAIEDNTADQIRALLSEEQKKKYNPSRPPHKMGPGADEPSVEDWMKATQQPVPPAGH